MTEQAGQAGQAGQQARNQAGLLFEVAPRDIISAPVRRWWPAHWQAVALLAPAGVFVLAVLAAPFVTTVIASFVAGPKSGLGNYGAVLSDPAVRHAMVNSVRWVLFAALVCVAGLLAAWPGRRAGRAWRIVLGVLAAPVAVSAFVAGVAFRLLFSRAAGGTNATFLGPGLIWVVLGLAFAWEWLGLAAIVFRARLAGLPWDLLRVARAFGAGRARRAWAVAFPAVLPAGALVLIVVLVAAARVFELVLAGAPGGIQDEVDVVGVHLWRFGSDLGNGQSAALAVLLSAFVAAVALAGLWGLSRAWPAGQLPRAARPAQRDDAAGEGTARRLAARGLAARGIGTLAAAAWVLPLAALLLASLHDPAAAATGGWWSGGWGLGSYREAFADGQLLPALGSTAARAVSASALLLVLAVPAAYALAWGGLPRGAVRAIVAVTAVLAVLPPQAVAFPLGYGLDHLQLLGAAAPLIGVHVAFGLPLAILLLRGAFTSVPRTLVRERQLDPVRGSALMSVIGNCWPALLAVAVLEFVLVWNDLLIGLLFGGTEAGQASLVLFEQTREFATNTGVLAAGAMLITVVPLALVLLTGKWLVRGLVAGVRR
jgi:alpha-glucoside transport system permease protein